MVKGYCDIVTHAEYLADVVAEWYLRLNENERYECSGIELKSGSNILRIKGVAGQDGCLEYTREKEYYAYDYPDLELNGVRARICR